MAVSRPAPPSGVALSRRPRCVQLVHSAGGSEQLVGRQGQPQRDRQERPEEVAEQGTLAAPQDPNHRLEAKDIPETSRGTQPSAVRKMKSASGPFAASR